MRQPVLTPGKTTLLMLGLSTVALMGVPGFGHYEAPAGPVHGVVLDEEGAPIADAEVALFDDQVYVADNDRFEVRVYSPRGAPVRFVRLLRPNVPVTADDLARYREERLAGEEDENNRRSLRRLLDAMPFPDTYPAFDRLVVDEVGNLWFAEYPRVRATRGAYTVFDATGRLLGTVRMSPGIRVVEIGDDYVLGYRLDELDVQHFGVYDLVK